MSRLEAAICGANPVPRAGDLVDSNEAAAVTLLVEQRRHTMTTTPTQPPQDTTPQPRRSDSPGGAPPPQSWRRPAIAFGTAFVALIAALGIVYAIGVFKAAPNVADTVPTTVVAPPTTIETQTRGVVEPVITSWPADESIEDTSYHFIGVSRDRLFMGDRIYAVVDGELVPGERLQPGPFNGTRPGRPAGFGSGDTVCTNDGLWAVRDDKLLTYVEENGWVPLATVPFGLSAERQRRGWEYSQSLEATPDGVLWVLTDTWHEEQGPGCRHASRWDGDTWTTFRCEDRGKARTQRKTLGPNGVKWDLTADFVFENGFVGPALFRIEGDTVETFHAPQRLSDYSPSWAPADGSYWYTSGGDVHRFYEGTWSQPLENVDPGPWKRLGSDKFRAFIGPDGALWGIIDAGWGKFDLVAFHGEEPTAILKGAELGYQVSVAPDGTIWTSISTPAIEATETELRRIVIPET